MTADATVPPHAGATVEAIDVDTVVVGAGPAGAAAATWLARSGRSVVLADKATFPRDKCCGDGLTTLALRELEALGLDSATVEGWHDVGSAWLRAPSGREVELPLPRTGVFAAVAPRTELDHRLVELARAAGADVREGWTFTALGGPAGDGDGAAAVTFTLAGGEQRTVRARHVVAADGMWSPVRKAAGAAIGGYRGEWHAFRQYAANVTGPAAERLIVWFEPDLLPGYAWSFPLPGGRANIGFGVLRDGERKVGDMADVWRDLLARPHVLAALGDEFTLEGRHTAWPIPARIDDVALTSGRVLFTGDAVAATDVMTGEGIGQALLTGRLAAEAIVAGGAVPAVGHAYERAVRHHLVADHRMSLLLRRALRHRRGANGAIRIVAASGRWGRERFARWMFEDEPRAIMVTPRRWHRRFLARPGPYPARTSPHGAGRETGLS